MTLRRLVIFAVLVGSAAIFLVYEQSRITRAGYEINRLSRDETGLIEQVRLLEVHVTRLRQPEFLERQGERLRIDLMRPSDARYVRVSSAWSESGH